MIPPRYGSAVDYLKELANDPTIPYPMARFVAHVSSFMVDTVTTDTIPDGPEIPEAPGLRTDFLLRKIVELEARIVGLELALTETNRRLPAGSPLPEATKTIFTIPVVPADGVDDARIREEIAKLPVGLDGPQVVDELVKLGLVERAR